MEKGEWKVERRKEPFKFSSKSNRGRVVQLLFERIHSTF